VKIRGWIVVDWWIVGSVGENRVLLLSKDGNQKEP
jgi:hypothetical protein